MPDMVVDNGACSLIPLPLILSVSLFIFFSLRHFISGSCPIHRSPPSQSHPFFASLSSTPPPSSFSISPSIFLSPSLCRHCPSFAMVEWLLGEVPGLCWLPHTEARMDFIALRVLHLLSSASASSSSSTATPALLHPCESLSVKPGQKCLSSWQGERERERKQCPWVS